MKKLAFLFSLICILMVSSCTSFEINNEIHPKVSVFGETVGLQYNLGDIKVADSLKGLPDEYIEYFEKHKHDIVLTLFIEFNSGKNSKTYFTYYLGGVELETNTNVVSSSILLTNKDSIDGFFLYQLNGKDYMTPEEEEKVKTKTLPKLTPEELENSEQKPVKTERKL